MTETRQGVQTRICSAAVSNTGLALVITPAGAGEKLGRVAVTSTTTDPVTFVSDSTASAIGEPVHCVPLCEGQTIQVRLLAAQVAGAKVAPSTGGQWTNAIGGRVVLETAGGIGELVPARVAVTSA